jgi:hypothetical protein
MFVVRLGLAALLATVLAACAGHPAGTFPSQPLAIQQLEGPAESPPTCKGQKNSKKYASVTVKLSTKGGWICIPEFAGWGGRMRYPSVKPPVNATLISSTTDYNGLPELGKGHAMFYLQFSVSGNTSLGRDAPGGAELWSKDLTIGKDYTEDFDITTNGVTGEGGCYGQAVKGKYGGDLGAIVKTPKAYTVTLAQGSVGFIETYSGKAECQL